MYEALPDYSCDLDADDVAALRPEEVAAEFCRTSRSLSSLVQSFALLGASTKSGEVDLDEFAARIAPAQAEAAACRAQLAALSARHEAANGREADLSICSDADRAAILMETLMTRAAAAYVADDSATGTPPRRRLPDDDRPVPRNDAWRLSQYRETLSGEPSVAVAQTYVDAQRGTHLLAAKCHAGRHRVTLSTPEWHGFDVGEPVPVEVTWNDGESITSSWQAGNRTLLAIDYREALDFTGALVRGRTLTTRVVDASGATHEAHFVMDFESLDGALAVLLACDDAAAELGPE